MTQTTQTRKTGIDILLGILMVVSGIIILGNSVIATAVSVKFLGWIALITGAVQLVGSLFRIGKGGFWSAALGGALVGALGLVMLRNPVATALTLTLVAGSMFFAAGVTRIVVGFQEPEYRWVLLISGALSAVLGLIIFFNLFAATLTLLGTLLGLQVLIEGFTLIVVGRPRRVLA